MAETIIQPPSMTLEQAANSVGMPDAIPNDVRTPEGRAAFEAELDQAEADLEAVSDRAESNIQRATGRRQLNMRGKVAAGVVASAALLLGTPQGQEVAKTVAEPVVEVAKDFNANLNNDRVFNPDAGNPANAEEVVSSWNENPSKTVVTVDAKYANDTGAEAEQAGLPAIVSSETSDAEHYPEG